MQVFFSKKFYTVFTTYYSPSINTYCHSLRPTFRLASTIQQIRKEQFNFRPLFLPRPLCAVSQRYLVTTFFSRSIAISFTFHARRFSLNQLLILQYIFISLIFYFLFVKRKKKSRIPIFNTFIKICNTFFFFYTQQICNNVYP